MTLMQTADIRGLPVTAPATKAVERLDTLINEIYYYRVGVQDQVAALLEEYPELGLGHVLLGYSLLTEGTIDVEAKAHARLLLAETLPATRRERLHQEALRAWIAGDVEARAAAWEQILIEWPTDLLAFRQYTAALFWSGDKQHQAEVTAGLVNRWSAKVPGSGHFLSPHASAMEEVGRYELAEQSARDALSIQPQDLWALHALAHVLEMQGRVGEGIELLSDAAGYLNDYNLFRGHLWWHLSLFHMAAGQFDEALALFDREIYPKESTFYLDIQNGASLLVRLEFQGVDVGAARWERLAQASLNVATRCTLWFTAMHHVIALARSGRIAAARSTLEYLASAGRHSPQAALAHDLSRAAMAFCDDGMADALAQMLALRQRHGELGASHAQQDLYEQIAVMAAFRLGDLARVRQLLKARLNTRVWDEASWQACLDGANAIDAAIDEPAVRAALRWA